MPGHGNIVAGSPNPTVSVIIPCYNPGLLLYRSLRSVVSQTRPAMEVIVVDDKSTDGSAELMRSYFPSVTFVRNTGNLGVSATRNHGAAIANGKVLAFLDADDEWRSDKLEKQIAAMLAASADVSLTGFRDMRLSVRDWGVRPLAGKLCDVFMSGIPFNASTVMVTKAAFDAAGGFNADLRRGEDVDLFYRLAQSGLQGCFVPDALAWYHHDNEASLTSDIRESSSFAALMHRLRDAVQDEASPDHLVTVRAATRHFTGRYLSACAHGKEEADLLKDLAAFGQGAHKTLARLVSYLPRWLRRQVARVTVQAYRLKQQRRFPAIRM